MTGQSETLKRALEALAEICGPALVGVPESQQPTVAPKVDPTVDIATGMAYQNHVYWAGDFGVWLKARCGHRMGREDSTSVSALHLDFIDWSRSRNEVPCTRRTIELLLRDAGFIVVDGMVQGLVLLADLVVAFPEATAEQKKDWRI
jgi:hypothetical protein